MKQLVRIPLFKLYKYLLQGDVNQRLREIILICDFQVKAEINMLLLF